MYAIHRNSVLWDSAKGQRIAEPPCEMHFVTVVFNKFKDFDRLRLDRNLDQ